MSGKVEAGPVFKSFWHSQDLRSSRNACLHGAGHYTTFCREKSGVLLLDEEINPWSNRAAMILLLSWYRHWFLFGFGSSFVVFKAKGLRVCNGSNRSWTQEVQSCWLFENKGPVDLSDVLPPFREKMKQLCFVQKNIPAPSLKALGYENTLKKWMCMPAETIALQSKHSKNHTSFIHIKSLQCILYKLF